MKWQGFLIILMLSSPWVSAAEPDKIVKFESALRHDSELAQSINSIYAKIFKTFGFQFEAEEYPARRGLEELRNGRVDGSVGRVGDLVKLFGLKDYIRIDTPMMLLTLSLWCNRNPDEMKKLKNPRIGYLPGSTYASRIVGYIEDRSVLVSPILGYRNMLAMMRKDRLECLLATESNLDTQRIGLDDLKGFYRHNVITSPSYPWISKKYRHLKEKLEKELIEQRNDSLWKKRFVDSKANCSDEFETLCPDGRVFQRQIKLQDQSAAAISSQEE